VLVVVDILRILSWAVAATGAIKCTNRANNKHNERGFIFLLLSSFCG
jgi:hypothetical protein